MVTSHDQAWYKWVRAPSHVVT